jgi:hypothetical protein
MAQAFTRICFIVIFLTIFVYFYSRSIKTYDEFENRVIIVNKDDFLNRNFIDKQEIKITLSKNNEEVLLPNTTPARQKLDEQRIFEFYHQMAANERKIYSQNKEDGVIETIFQLLNIKNLSKYFIEIGTESGKFYFYRTYLMKKDKKLNFFEKDQTQLKRFI